MAKLTLNDITSGAGSAGLHNSNNDLIEAAIENTLSLDGTAPNQMEANLDMNSNRIINVAEPVADTDGATKNYVDTVAASITGGAGGGEGGVTDHGLLLGLGDDDHPQYAAIAQSEIISGAWEFRNAGGVGILSESVPDTYESSLWLQCTENYSAGKSFGTVALSLNKNGVAGGGAYMGIYQQDGGAADHLAAGDAPYLYLGRFAGEFAYEAGNPKLNVGDVIGEITWDTKNESSDGAVRVYKLSVVYDGAGTGTVGGAYLEHRNHLGITWRYETDGGLVGYASSAEATGGSQGPGTINCKGIYVDGVAVTGAGTINMADIANYTETAIGAGEIIKYDGAGYVNNTLAEAGILGLSGGTLTGTLNSRSVIPTADSTYALGSATYAFSASYVDSYEFGQTTDTSLTRLAAGKVGVEGKAVIKHTGSYTSGEVTFSTADPSGGSSGDIWFKYTA